MSKLPRHPALLVAFAGLTVVAAVLLLPRVFDDGDRPAFSRTGGNGYSSADGEELLGDRPRLRARVLDPAERERPALVTFVGPGSEVFDSLSIALDRDSDPIRIRQLTLADLFEPEVYPRKGSPVRWRGFVATEDPPPPGEGRPRFGPWRPAGREGVLVRPGQTVRLRTRYDVAPRAPSRSCRDTIVEDGLQWVGRSGDGPWEPLRVRVEDSGRDVIAVARSGHHGPLAFTPQRPCGKDGAEVFTVPDPPPEAAGLRDGI